MISGNIYDQLIKLFERLKDQDIRLYDHGLYYSRDIFINFLKQLPKPFTKAHKAFLKEILLNPYTVLVLDDKRVTSLGLLYEKIYKLAKEIEKEENIDFPKAYMRAALATIPQVLKYIQNAVKMRKGEYDPNSKIERFTLAEVIKRVGKDKVIYIKDLAKERFAYDIYESSETALIALLLNHYDVQHYKAKFYNEALEEVRRRQQDLPEPELHQLAEKIAEEKLRGFIRERFRVLDNKVDSIITLLKELYRNCEAVAPLANIHYKYDARAGCVHMLFPLREGDDTKEYFALCIDESFREHMYSKKRLSEQLYSTIRSFASFMNKRMPTAKRRRVAKKEEYATDICILLIGPYPAKYQLRNKKTGKLVPKVYKGVDLKELLVESGLTEEQAEALCIDKLNSVSVFIIRTERDFKEAMEFLAKIYLPTRRRRFEEKVPFIKDKSLRLLYSRLCSYINFFKGLIKRSWDTLRPKIMLAIGPVKKSNRFRLKVNSYFNI